MATEKSNTAAAEVADFGLSVTSLHIDPAAPLDELLFDTLCLVRNALAVFERISDDGEVPELHFAGLYMLRQGVCALTAANLWPRHGEPQAAADAP